MTNDHGLHIWLRWTWFVSDMNPTTGLALLGDPVGQKSRQWRFTHNLIMWEKWWWWWNSWGWGGGRVIMCLHYFFTRFAISTPTSFFIFYLFIWSSNVMVYYFQLQVGQQCCHPPFYLHTYIFICLCTVVSLNENYKHPNLCSFHGPHIIVFSLWNLGPLYPTISYWGFLESSLSFSLTHTNTNIFDWQEA